MIVDYIYLINSGQQSDVINAFWFHIFNTTRIQQLITSSHTPLGFKAPQDLFLMSWDKLIALQNEITLTTVLNNYQGLPLVLAEYMPLFFG